MDETSQDLEVRNSVVFSNNEYTIYKLISLISKEFEKHNFQPSRNKVKNPLIKIISSPETIGFIVIAILSIKNRISK